MPYRLAMTTCPDMGVADAIACALVEERLAACVNILPGVRSFYRWKGKICQDGEFLLIAKTLEEEFEALAETIRELHTYDLPEILAFAVTRGSEDFLGWIASSVDKSSGVVDDEEDDGVDFPDED